VSPLVLPIGLLIGLSLGALGGGGSILTVPALVHLLGQDPRQATSSSLLIVGVTSLIALVPHARRGNVRFGQGLVFGALGTAGSLVGSALSATVAPGVLLTAFAALMVVVGVLMLRRSGTAPSARVLTLRPRHVDLPTAAKVVVTATAVGLLTGFLGVGGGFALVPALVLVLSFRMPVAVGTSLLVIAVNSATALMARAAVDAPVLDWGVVLAFTAAAVVGSLAGGQVAARLEPRHLTRAFAVLLLAMAAYTAVRSVPTLYSLY
jgi:uncharacterized membrane protein YfcA